MTRSTRASLDEELLEMNSNILKLSSMVEEALRQAMIALAQREVPMAEAVIKNDEAINHLRYDIEEHGMRILALQQPAAADLRQVVAALVIASELERIGDHAKAISRVTIQTQEFAEDPSLHQLPKMSKRVRKMLRRAIQAYVTRDADLAMAVIEKEVRVEQLFTKIVNELHGEIEDPVGSPLLPTYMLNVAHDLARVGDRIENIAERVIYVVRNVFIEIAV